MYLHYNDIKDGKHKGFIVFTFYLVARYGRFFTLYLSVATKKASVC
jgi:hypothetical protein